MSEIDTRKMQRNFRTNAKNLRVVAHNNMKLKAFGPLVGIHYKSYSRYENGGCFPRVDQCIKIAEFAGVTVKQLFMENIDWEGRSA